MKTNKRFLVAAISIALAFTFPGCSSDSGGSPGAEPDVPGVGSDNPAGDPEAPGSSSGGEQSSSSSAPAEPPAPKCGDGADEACFSNGAVNISVPKCAGNPQGYDPSLYECQEGKNGVYLKEGLEDGDGNKYAAVLIGEQTWMAENLNYAATDSKCYQNNDSNCDTYGRLYNWATAMDIDASCNSALIADCGASVNTPHQGVCPEGWHLPSDAEWTALTTAIGGTSGGGTKLKATSGWSGSPGNGTDDYGFSALPGGYEYSSGSFYGVGSIGYWWSSTQDVATVAFNRNMSGSNSNVSRDIVYDSYSSSIRCLQN
jgi:uncharacterized protein (TIGR02145 family)